MGEVCSRFGCVTGAVQDAFVLRSRDPSVDETKFLMMVAQQSISIDLITDGDGPLSRPLFKVMLSLGYILRVVPTAVEDEIIAEKPPTNESLDAEALGRFVFLFSINNNKEPLL